MESVKECFNEAVRAAGKIDILVNNATLNAGKKLEDISELQIIIVLLTMDQENLL